MAESDNNPSLTVRLGRDVLRVQLDPYGRLYFQVRTPEVVSVDPNEWYCWAEWKQCELPGPAHRIADFLWAALEAEAKKQAGAEVVEEYSIAPGGPKHTIEVK